MTSGKAKQPDHAPLTYLVVIFALLAAGILAAGYVMYQSQEQSIRSEAEGELTAVAELKTHELVQWRDERFGDGTVLSQNPVFIAIVRRCLVQPADSAARQQLLDWLNQVKEKYHYNQIRLMNAQGETILSVPERLRTPPGDERKLFAELLRTGKSQLSDFFRSGSDQRIYLAIRFPIVDQANNGKPIGLLSLRIDPEQYLYPYILKWPTPSRSAETLLVRRDGDDVLYLNNLRFHRDAALTLRIPLTRTEVPAVQAVLGKTGIVEGLDYRGAPVIADVRSVPGSPWYLVTHMDAAEVYAPARERLWLILGVMAAMLMAAAITLTTVWRQQLVIHYREQAKTATALREANELFALFMRYSPVYVYIKEVSANESRTLQASDNFEQMLGIPAEKMRGKTMTELFPADFAAKITADDREVVASRQPLTTEEELNGRCYTTFKFPITLEDKTLLAGYTVDSTERKTIEESYRRFTRLTSDYVHYCTRTGTGPFRIQWIEGAVEPISGYNADEILAMGCWLPLVHPDDREAVFAYLSRLAPDEIGEMEFRIVTKRGEVRWVAEKCRCEAGQAMDEVALFGTVKDITERRQAEETTQRLAHDLEQRAMELAVANQELEAFSYTLSHDLRSYLARISLAGESLQEFDREQLSEQGKFCQQTIVDTCQRMDDLIATMLTLGHISRRELQLEEVDLSALAEEIGAELARAEPDRVIHLAIAPGLRVCGDSHLLHVALENLLGNACKYTRGKPEAHISLNVRSEDDRRVFAVADNGTGFDMAEAGKLFSPFQRLSSASAFPGFGVGLTTVQRIIQRHGGEIWAEAVPGQGARFYFTLPEQCA